MVPHEEPDGLIGMPLPIGVCQPAPHAIFPGVYPALFAPVVALLANRSESAAGSLAAHFCTHYHCQTQ